MPNRECRLISGNYCETSSNRSLSLQQLLRLILILSRCSTIAVVVFLLSDLSIKSGETHTISQHNVKREAWFLFKICDAEHNDESSTTHTITCNYVLCAVFRDINIQFCTAIDFSTKIFRLKLDRGQLSTTISIASLLCNLVVYGAAVDSTHRPTHRFSLISIKFSFQ